MIAPASILALTLATLAGNGPTPVGTWRTIDDETHKPRALVRIEERDGVLSGRVVQLFREPGEDPDPLCEDCPGERHHQPVLGMTILWNFRYDGHGWGGGEVLDPEEGRIYSANLHLRDDGARLVLRGYIGVPLLGRNQLWERVDP